MSIAKFSALRSALANRNYAIYVSGNSISLIGFWMQRLAIGWLTWETSHSEFWVGAVAFAELAPLIVICPIFGVWADRFDRKMLTILCQASMMIQSFALFILVSMGMINIELLFIFAILDGVLHAAHQPVRLSIIPNLVEKKDLVAASSFTAVVFNVARFVGPALAGVVISLYGAQIAILCNAVSYLVILVAWFYIEVPKNLPSTEKKSILSDIKEGFKYITDIPALKAMFILQTIIALCARPLTFILSAFVGAIYDAGPELLAVFTSAMGLGAIMAGLKIAMSGATRGLVRVMLINTVITIITMIGFSSTAIPWLATLLIFIMGFSITLCTVASQTMVQNSIDDRVRGRVLSLWVAFARGGPAFGVLIIGWFADYYGLMWPNIGAAVLCFLGLLLLLGKRKEMRSYFES